MSGDSAAVARHPQVLWAQRNNCVYVTIALSDVKDEVIDIQPDSFHFKGNVETPSKAAYEVKFDFYAEVDPSKAVRQTGDRVITFCINKKENAVWPRFLKETAKQPWLKTDFNRWKDLDGSDSDDDGGFGGGFGGSGAPNFNDMLSMMGNKDLGDLDDDEGHESEADSDDDELPDLEEPEKAKPEKDSPVEDVKS